MEPNIQQAIQNTGPGPCVPLWSWWQCHPAKGMTKKKSSVGCDHKHTGNTHTCTSGIKKVQPQRKLHGVSGFTESFNLRLKPIKTQDAPLAFNRFQSQKLKLIGNSVTAIHFNWIFTWLSPAVSLMSASQGTGWGYDACLLVEFIRNYLMLQQQKLFNSLPSRIFLQSHMK